MGFSDIIQPGLIQLQPSFDDYMDTLPSLSGMLSLLLLTCRHYYHCCRVFHLQPSLLTLLVGCQEGHLARKNVTDEVLVWLSSGTKCK